MKYKKLLIVGLSLILAACSSQYEEKEAFSTDSVPSREARSVQKTKTPKTTKTTGDDSRDSEGGYAEIAQQPGDNQPFKPDAPRMPGTRVNSVSVPTKAVALTFDDGPHGSLTPRILNILAKYNAKGTFFMVGGNVQLHPGIVRRMVAEGHEVANHTWNHPNFNKSSKATIASQIARTNDAIIKACGVKPRLIRPPYGACSSALSSWIKQEYGLTTVMWSVDTNDWRKPGVAAITSRAVNGARPGSIILVHDIHSMTASSIEGIVRGLKNRGFELVTVSQLIRMGQQYSGQGASYASKPSTVEQPQSIPVSLPADTQVAEAVVTENPVDVTPLTDDAD